MANLAAKEKISDVVVTVRTSKPPRISCSLTCRAVDTQVPPFFTHHERQAVLDALDLAQLRPLALVNDGAAIAVNYALSRTFPADEPQYHLFYDAGAGSVRATLVAFKTAMVPDYPGAKTSKNVTQLEVKGVGYDRTVGGLLLDHRVRELVIEAFESKHAKALSTPVRENPRAMAKLLKEAARVKEVLSANIESAARVSSQESP